MRKLTTNQKKESTLKKEASSNRQNELSSHIEASKLLADTFNKLRNHKSNITIDQNLILKILEISGIKIDAERKAYFQNYYNELNTIYLINCNETDTVASDPVSDFIKDLFDLGPINKDERRIADLYEKKTATQLSLFFDKTEKEEIDVFLVQDYIGHLRVEVLKSYLEKKENLNEYLNYIRPVLDGYTTGYSYDIMKMAKLNEYKLSEKKFSSPRNIDSKYEVHQIDFIFKIIIPYLSLYIGKLKNLKSPLLKQCENSKCLKVFPTSSMRFDSKVCSKICGTEKNRK